MDVITNMFHILNKTWIKYFLKQVMVNPDKTFLFVVKDEEERKRVCEIISTFFSNQKNISLKNFGYYCVTAEQEVKQDMFYFKEDYPMWDDILISRDIHDLKIKDFLHKHRKVKY